MIDDVLYRRSISTPLLKCLSLQESFYVLQEIHEGICGLYTGSIAPTTQVMQTGYYWPTILQDAVSLVKRYDKC
jgi:hypothetical protein